MGHPTLLDSPLPTPPGVTDTWSDKPADQQPEWYERLDFPFVARALRDRAPLVDPAEVHLLAEQMAEAAHGRAQVLQLGDCAEDLRECTAEHTDVKLGVLGDLADTLAANEGTPVVRVGRLGGQLAKPRSKPTEIVDGVEMPAFRGQMVNSEEATVAARTHDPRRLLRCHDAAATVLEEVRAHRDQGELDGLAGGRLGGGGPWSSHEALVLDYEGPQLRRDPVSGRVYLSSTHLPWIGERTRRPEGAHVAMLSGITNPVGVKVGPNAEAEDVLEVCEQLDPERVPGQLVLIARLGSGKVEGSLPSIVRAVRRAGHPAVWLCDPMHGNTVLRAGTKTRELADVTSEVTDFRAVVEAEGVPAGGLHLEAASTSVTECLGAGVGEGDLHRSYSTLCDPRLNPEQAREVLEAWSA